MNGATRLVLIAMAFLALSAPAAGLCEVVGERMASCAMMKARGMAGCASETALAAKCCELDAVDAVTELILIRPTDEPAASPETADAKRFTAPAVPASILSAPDPAPPPRVAPYRLLSSLLL